MTRLWNNIKKFFSETFQSEKSMVIKTPYIFPCTDDNCLVRVACTQSCDKIEMKDYKLRDFFEEHKCCPDCGSATFYEGPSGGMSQNLKWGGCDHWYNVALPFSVERIHIAADGVFTQ